MHQNGTHTKRELRERNFKDKVNDLATQITSKTCITVSKIVLEQYLYRTDAIILTKIAKQQPKKKSRIKCIIILDCKFNKLCKWPWALAHINNILSCQWELVKIEEFPDKCGILLSFNPHNLKIN